MKALTVQQPWAWAIVHGGKDVENRTQVWSYRGPLAIHAGQRWSDRGERSPLVVRAYFEAQRRRGWQVIRPERAIAEAVRDGLGRFLMSSQFGAIIGVVDLVDVHHDEHVEADGYQHPICCQSPWAEGQYDAHPTGKTRRDITHLVLENPRPLAEPIPCRGALGLWTPPADVLEQLQAVA